MPPTPCSMVFVLLIPACRAAARISLIDHSTPALLTCRAAGAALWMGIAHYLGSSRGLFTSYRPYGHYLFRLRHGYLSPAKEVLRC
ncbi:hypothetical protein F5B18DRAFT_605901, partial [Nemania serpens]